MLFMHLSKLIELHKTKSKLQCKLWTLVNNMHHNRLISFNKFTTLMQDVDNRGTVSLELGSLKCNGNYYLLNFQ